MSPFFQFRSCHPLTERIFGAYISCTASHERQNYFHHDASSAKNQAHHNIHGTQPAGSAASIALQKLKLAKKLETQ